MAAVIDLLQATAPVLAAALLNSVWQGLLLVAAVAVVVRAWTPLNAATRHAVWVFTLLVLLALPVLGCWRYASDSGADNALIAKLERPHRRPAPPEPPPLPGEPTEREIQAINVDNTTAPAGPSFQMPFSWARLGTGLWFLIVCGLLFRVGRSHRRLRRLMHRATPLPETHQHHLRSIAKSFGLRLPVTVARAPGLATPLAAGLRRPMVLVPLALAEQLSEAEWTHVLTHELAHIYRNDTLTKWLQRVAEAVLFFNPAVWWIGRRLDLEREVACDDWTVTLTGPPTAYARSLLRLVEQALHPSTHGFVASALFGRNVLRHRLDLLLDAHRRVSTRMIRSPLLGAAVSLLLGATALVQTAPGLVDLPERTPSLAAMADAARSVRLPDTPAGRLLPATLDALEADLTEAPGATLTLYRVLSYHPHELVALAYLTPSGRRLALRLTVDPKPNGSVSDLDVLLQ